MRAPSKRTDVAIDQLQFLSFQSSAAEPTNRSVVAALESTHCNACVTHDSMIDVSADAATTCAGGDRVMHCV